LFAKKHGNPGDFKKNIIHLTKNTNVVSEALEVIGFLVISHARIHLQALHSSDGYTSNTKPQQLRRFAVDRLKDRDVASRYYDKLESELQDVQAQPLSLDEKCEKLEETIQRVATNTIGYTRKQANKEWFDEE
jgi:hypothetical protein